MSKKVLSVTQSEISHFCRKKTYPDGSFELLLCSSPIFREKGWEAKEPRAAAERGEPSGDNRRQLRRARTAVSDICRCNDFRYFVTLTLDQKKVNRYDVREVTKKLKVWLSNEVQRRGLKYVLVPERHKDGALHFHGFFNAALPVVDSGTIDMGRPRRPISDEQRAVWLDLGGHVIYNLPRWTFGFTTAIELYGDYGAAVGYVLKYVTKQEEKIGGRWYYSGGALLRPVVEVCDPPEGLRFESGETFEIPEAGLRFSRFRYDAEGWREW